MYTVTKLQKELEKAKDNLREVENYIQKVDGKSSNNPSLRFNKQQEFRQERGRYVTQSNWNTEGAPLSRRRQFSSNVDEVSLGIKRKTLRSSDEETSPVRKKSFPSVVGEVKLPDLNIGLKSRKRDRDEGRGRVSVFARLSGPPQPDIDDEEDEAILKTQPVLPSRVFPISHPTPSREQVLASQKTDEVLKQRNRRMFGALVGTLQQFRREETQDKEREVRRQQIEKKLEEDAIKEKERLQQEKKALLVERVRRESDIKRIEWSLNRVKEFAAWEESVSTLQNFIQTEAEPHIFYLPKVHNDKTLVKLEESKKLVQDMIRKRLANLNEEIESSEKKAKRMSSDAMNDTTNGVNKENVCEDAPETSLDVKEEGLGSHENINEEYDEAQWEERNVTLDMEDKEMKEEEYTELKEEEEDKGNENVKVENVQETKNEVDKYDSDVDKTDELSGIYDHLDEPFDALDPREDDEDKIEDLVTEMETIPDKVDEEDKKVEENKAISSDQIPLLDLLPTELPPSPIKMTDSVSNNEAESKVEENEEIEKVMTPRKSRSRSPRLPSTTPPRKESKSRSPVKRKSSSPNKTKSPTPRKPASRKSKSRTPSRTKSPIRRRKRSKSRSSSRRRDRSTKRNRRSRSRSRRRGSRARRDSPVRRARRSRSRSRSRRQPRSSRRSRSRSNDRNRRSSRRSSPRRNTRRPRSRSTSRTKKRSASSSSSSSSSTSKSD